MNPRLHDDAVTDLPLSTARAELLEEIISTPVLDRPDPDAGTPGRRRLLVPVAAAATVAGLLVVPSYLLTRGDEALETGTPASSSSTSPFSTSPAPTSSAPTSPAPTSSSASPPPTASAPAVPASRSWAVLEADGWTATYVSIDPGSPKVEYQNGEALIDYGGREVAYQNGGASLDVVLRPAESRATFVEDRQRTEYLEVDPGTPVRLLGEDARMWPYSATDHTTIGRVEGGVYPEVRARGMDQAAYVALLGQLAWTDEAGFEASLPEEFVTTEELASAVDRMASDMVVPAGFEWPAFEQKDPYRLGARVSGAVACAWLDAFAEATEQGDQRAADEAAAALAGSREWDVLHEMSAEGRYPEVLWDYADKVQAGRVPEAQESLGCP